jgi:mitogen-activated protein kinase organizer 1
MLQRIPQKMGTYNLRTARLVMEDVSHPITSFSMSNDGVSVTALCLDGIARLWDRGVNDDRRRKGVFQKLHSSHVSNNYKVECAFTSNDEYMISGSECSGWRFIPWILIHWTLTVISAVARDIRKQSRG